MRILAINFGGIGDEILFLPTLSSIRDVYPKAHLTLLLEPRSKSFQQVTDLLNEVIEFDVKKKPLLPGDLYALVELIRRGKFDLVISSEAHHRWRHFCFYPELRPELAMEAICLPVGS